MGTYININFPFSNSNNGFFLQLNKNKNSAIKADLMHLILTRKGQRLYAPDFGTDLLKFIFQPNDDMTLLEIKEEIKTVVKKYLPNLTIKEIKVTETEQSEYAAVIYISYIVSEGVFQTEDFVTVSI